MEGAVVVVIVLQALRGLPVIGRTHICRQHLAAQHRAVARPELFDHILTDLITILTDGRSNRGKNIVRIAAKQCLHFEDNLLPDHADRSPPAGMSKRNSPVLRIHKI